MEEIFDIIDTQGNPTGETVTREKAHAEGIPHRTAHIWIIAYFINMVDREKGQKYLRQLDLLEWEY